MLVHRFAQSRKQIELAVCIEFNDDTICERHHLVHRIRVADRKLAHDAVDHCHSRKSNRTEIL